ncbi:hypothetical protein Tco_0500391 [Tanacetum coccineum]
MLKPTTTTLLATCALKTWEEYKLSWRQLWRSWQRSWLAVMEIMPIDQAPNSRSDFDDGEGLRREEGLRGEGEGGLRRDVGVRGEAGLRRECGLRVEGGLRREGEYVMTLYTNGKLRTRVTHTTYNGRKKAGRQRKSPRALFIVLKERVVGRQRRIVITVVVATSSSLTGWRKEDG